MDETEGGTGGATPGLSLSFLLALGRGGLGWPQEREVFELRQSHRTLDRGGGQALGPCLGIHGDTVAQSKVA